MDLEKLDINKIIDALVNLLRAMNGGWATVAAFLLSVFGVAAFWWWWNKIKDKAAKDETERKRREDQAKNPKDNADAERDGKKAADEIEEIIHDSERQGE